VIEAHHLLVSTFSGWIQLENPLTIIESILKIPLRKAPFDQLVHHHQVHVLEALSFE
jgi:hypothetical protein